MIYFLRFTRAIKVLYQVPTVKPIQRFLRDRLQTKEKGSGVIIHWDPTLGLTQLEAAIALSGTNVAVRTGLAAGSTLGVGALAGSSNLTGSSRKFQELFYYMLDSVGRV